MNGHRTFPLLCEMAEGKTLDASKERGRAHGRAVLESLRRLREMGLIESIHRITPAGQEYVRDVLAQKARKDKKANG